jgi:hypothetical protein
MKIEKIPKKQKNSHIVLPFFRFCSMMMIKLSKRRLAMRDICTTVDAPSAVSGIRFHYFVYEMELHKLPQPFFQSH